MIELCDEALAEATGDDARSARILAFRSWRPPDGADVHAALVDARAALEKAERVGDPALLAVAIARVGQAETWAADVTSGSARARRGDRGTARLVLEYTESPRVCWPAA